ncbi:MAG: PH domain-containing protein [Candidatus Peribacteraceae bacterium]|nr:PH domain-containing protein [Candidatus Peribacteraceae bacterium]
MLEKFFFKQHLGEDEKIHLVVHKHWVVGVKDLILPTVIFVLLWALLLSMRDKFIFYGVAILSVGAVIWWIRNFLDYYLDVWLITNKGVIDLEWKGWFHRTSARILYSDIEAASYEIKGILPTIFRIGTLSLEKISTGSEISMPFVKNPKQVESKILENLETYMHKKNLKDAKTVQNILAEFVAGSMNSERFEEEDEEETEEPDDADETEDDE